MKTQGDNKILAHIAAVARVEQLLTIACLTGEDELREQAYGWAESISEEWAFPTCLRAEIADSVRAVRDRPLNDE